MSKHRVRLYAEVGRRAPLHAGGAPKVLLAYMPPEEQARILRSSTLRRVSGRTITDVDQLQEILADIRHKGYSVAVGDVDPDVHSIAAPIRDHTGCVLAAVSVAGPRHRFAPEKVEHCIRLVCRAAARISRLLGHLPAREEQAIEAGEPYFGQLKALEPMTTLAQ